MSETAPVSFQSNPSRRTPRWARNLFFGGAVGLVVALVLLFLLALFYGKSLGLSASQDAVVAFDLTLFHSQLVGIVGMIIGAAAGAVVGSIAHLLHRH